MDPSQLKEINPWEIKHGDVVYGQLPSSPSFIPIGEAIGFAKSINRGTSWRIDLSRSSAGRYIDVPAGKKLRIVRKPIKRD